jgi:hypothetical protein
VRRRGVAALVSIALALSACSSAGTAAGGDGADGSPAAGATQVVGSPSPSPTADPARGLLLEAVGARPPSYVAIPHERLVPMWEEPRGDQSDFRFDSRNPRGGLTPMLIVDGRMDDAGELWFEVLLPIRPNGASAWVRERDVRTHERRDRIRVYLGERILEHYRDGRLVGRFRVGIGQPQYPTGRGTFYVWVKVPYSDPSGPYGIYALGLSGFSPVLSDWPSHGRMAIHGTPYASNRGQAVSHGCVRVYNPDMRTLIQVPLGTPVIITE